MKKKGIGLILTLAIIATFTSLASAQEGSSFEMGAAWHGNRQIIINRPGIYRLRDDLKVRNGTAIVIRGSNVTLDLGGNSVTTDTPGTGSGVLVEGQKGVEVRNGKVGGFNR